MLLSTQYGLDKTMIYKKELKGLLFFFLQDGGKKNKKINFTPICQGEIKKHFRM